MTEVLSFPISQASEINNAEKPFTTWSVPSSLNATFGHQNLLPRLPIPDLGSTVVKYLKSVRPLLNDEEFSQTCKVAIESAVSDQAQTLQSRLMQRQKAAANSSWLIDWWNDWCYLTDREPVVFFVSYFYAFKDFRTSIPLTPTCSSQACVAATLIHHAIEFREEILLGRLTPDQAGGRPQCMAQYAFLFNCSRIPGKAKDTYSCFEPRANSHIVVFSNGHAYAVDAMDRLGRPRSPASLAQDLQGILACSRAAGRNPTPVGLLTSDERNRWFVAREALMVGPVGSANCASLLAIESAALAVCLDAEDVEGADEEGIAARARAFWHGDGCNRFYDKTLQFIVLPSGRAGFLGEHALADGSPTLRLCDYVAARITARTAAPSPPPASGAGTYPSGVPGVRELRFELPPAVCEAAAHARSAFAQLVAEHGLAVAVCGGLGRRAMAALGGVGADALCQLAIQVAYRRRHGAAVATYEAASTRGFLHGRTETIRSCTPEAASLVAALSDQACGDSARRTALNRAAAAHRRLAREAGEGIGVDRHLLGLRLARREGEPELPLLADPSYRASCRWELSTSTLASEGLENWGFGEVTPTGYGIGYSVLADAATFTVTCREAAGGAAAARARAMADAVRAALEELVALCRRTPSPRAGEGKARL